MAGLLEAELALHVKVVVQVRSAALTSGSSTDRDVGGGGASGEVAAMKAVLSSRWPPGTRELGVADCNYRAMLVKAVPCVWVREGA